MLTSTAWNRLPLLHRLGRATTTTAVRPASSFSRLRAASATYLPLLLRALTRQLEWIVSHRLRRGINWERFHAQLWGRQRLTELLAGFSRRILAHPARLLLGGSVLSNSGRDSGDNYDWDKARISDNLIGSHRGDVDYIQVLLERTLTCKKCGARSVIDGAVEGVSYCACADRKSSVYGVQTDDVSWTPFLEKKDILVWRQEHSEGSGMYAYKMYGRFDDVTPNEFLEVQLDTSEFRLSWDTSTAQLYVIEEESDAKKDSLSQLCYWETNWPRFFSNRDYVTNRRCQVYAKEGVAVIYTKSATHPTCPKKAKNHRVEEYWSVLTVKPTTPGGWGEPGLEFSLTAFEDPGVSLPASITTWVAIRGMPEFMANLRKACLQLRTWKAKGQAKTRGLFTAEPEYMKNVGRRRNKSGSESKDSNKTSSSGAKSSNSNEGEEQKSRYVYERIKL